MCENLRCSSQFLTTVIVSREQCTVCTVSVLHRMHARRTGARERRNQTNSYTQGKLFNYKLFIEVLVVSNCICVYMCMFYSAAVCHVFLLSYIFGFLRPAQFIVAWH